MPAGFAGAGQALGQALGQASGRASGRPGQPIVLAAAATGIADHITAAGGDIDAIFGRTGIAPAMAGSPTLKLKLSSFCGLFEEAARQTGHDNFGLKFGNQFKPRDLGLWGYAAVSSPTLGTALENLVGLFRFHQESSLMRLVRDPGGLMRLEYRITAPDIVERRQDAELSLGMFLNVFREGLSGAWAPEEVHFEHPKPLDWQPHEAAFSAPVYFSQPTNALLFRPEIMEQTMPGCDLTLMILMRTCLERLAGQTRAAESLLGQVRNTVRMKLPEGYPRLEEVGAALQLSPATLRRELSREGVAYKGLVEDVRRGLAIAYIKQRQLPFSEIALLLGYSELSAFSRAVRRWTGECPRSVRAQLLKE